MNDSSFNNYSNANTTDIVNGTTNNDVEDSNIYSDG